MIKARSCKRSQSASPAHVLCTHLPFGILGFDLRKPLLRSLGMCYIECLLYSLKQGGHVKCSRRKNIFIPSSTYGMWRSVSCGLLVDMLALNLFQML